MKKQEFSSLKNIRELLKKTQKTVAEESGISESYYNLIENGKRPNVPMPIADKISKSLKITLNQFFLLCNLTKCQDKKQNIS